MQLAAATLLPTTIFLALISANGIAQPPLARRDFFFVHELGHWMQDQVLGQRHDASAEMAKKNAETARWQYETVANRAIPHGEEARAFFTREYDKLTEDQNAYGWFQLQMVILVYEEKPPLSFKQAINKLSSENYRD